MTKSESTNILEEEWDKIDSWIDHGRDYCLPMQVYVR